MSEVEPRSNKGDKGEEALWFLEGPYGVEYHVRAAISEALNNVLRDAAVNSNLAQYSPEQIVDQVLKPLGDLYTKDRENMINFIVKARGNQSKG